MQLNFIFNSINHYHIMHEKKFITMFFSLIFFLFIYLWHLDSYTQWNDYHEQKKKKKITMSFALIFATLILIKSRFLYLIITEEEKKNS